MESELNQPGKKVVLLISGGPDSATLAKLAEKEIEENGPNSSINAIYLRSGHPSDEKEIEAANRVIQRVGGRLEIIDIQDVVQSLGSGRVLIHSEAAILPHGNSFVLSLASSYARRLGASEIWIGLHKDDADENIEYTRGFIDMFEQMSKIISPGLKIVTPLIALTKQQVFKLGSEIGVDYSITWSCIRGSKEHCGQCGACRSRRRAFNLANMEDPTLYKTEPLALDTAVHG